MLRRELMGIITAAVGTGTGLAVAIEPQSTSNTPSERLKETRRGDCCTGNSGAPKRRCQYHIGRQKDEKESIAIVRAAVDAGITFMDNCWDYHDGGSEIRMGKALTDG